MFAKIINGDKVKFDVKLENFPVEIFYTRKKKTIKFVDKLIELFLNAK